MPCIRAVLLDADGVVQLPHRAWRTSLEALCGDPARTDEFLADVFAAEKPCLAGGADFEPALAEVLRKWRSSIAVGDALRLWTEIEPSADILELVRALRSSGFAVALATNQQAHRANFMTSTLGYAEHFDHLLYSCELGHSKPSSEYFLAALAKVMVDPVHALFIDDHETNVLAARECGLQAEVYHLSEGMGRIQEILLGHGLSVESLRGWHQRHQPGD
jgi:putative hydrolase of the HAD superfamily